MNRANSGIEWTEANRLFLAGELARVRARLGGNPESDSRCVEISHCMDAPPAIDRLFTLFGLSPFERDILLLTAGIETDSGLAAQCAGPVTFGLALAKLAKPHWGALTPI